MAHPLRVLILEDRPADAELMVHALRQAGFEPESRRVDSEQDYLAALAAPCDVILADLSMPRFDALRALQLLQDRALEVPFIIVSGGIGEDLAVEALRRGASDYLLKDRLARLAPAVNRALNAKRLRDEKLNAEAAVRASEERFRALVEHASDAITLIGPDGRVVYSSPSAARITGYDVRERVGKSALDNVHEADRARVMHALADLRTRPNQTVRLEVKILTADRSMRWVDVTATNLLDLPSVGGIVVNYRDVTERKLHEEAITRLSRAVEQSPSIVVITDPSEKILYVNTRFVQVTGFDPADVIGTKATALGEPVWPKAYENLLSTIRAGDTWRGEFRAHKKDGGWYWEAASISGIVDAQGQILNFVKVAEDVTDHKLVEEALRHSEEQYRTLIEQAADGIFLLDGQGRFQDANPRGCELLGFRPEELRGLRLDDVIDPEDVARRPIRWETLRAGEAVRVERQLLRKDGSRFPGEISAKLLDDGRLLGIVRDITERQQAQAQIQQQLETLTSLYASARKLARTLDLDALAADVVRTSTTVFGAQVALVGRAEPDGIVRVLKTSTPDPGDAAIEIRWDDTLLGRGPTGQALRTGFPVIVPDLRADPSLPRDRVSWYLDRGATAAGAFPLIAREEPFGILLLGAVEGGFFSPTRVEFLQAYAHLVAAALENARLYEDAGRRLAQLQALRDIDTAITGSLDARITMGIIVDKATTHLHVDAADLLLLNPRTNELEYATGRGFRTGGMQQVNLRLGQGHAGRAALERVTVRIDDLHRDPGGPERASAFQAEGFTSYYATPLIAKGHVNGVLELFHRAPLSPDHEWLEFLATLAGQAAVAVESASLFDGLQRANLELTLAYDTTLEGWSRALDLRDKETEGHTQRVADLTLQLARAMDVGEDHLVHVRRGALLHDIGKMGIPDSILLKPGPLTDVEWKTMRMHPMYAEQLLSPIPYLRPALPIPSCHHEKWDGTGYPRGLKGEDIPLEARIFAVVDVWDALTSDRPYRPAWPPERALGHIQDEAGKHFDPSVVAAFLAIMPKPGTNLA